MILKPVVENAPQQGYLETLAEVLRSRSIAEATVRQLELWKHPEYEPVAGGVSSGVVDKVPDSVVDRFIANTVIAAVPGSTVLNVSVRSTDPQLAATAANAISHGFIERDLASRLAGAKDAADWLGRRLDDQRARVTDTESTLQRYREAQNAASLDDRQNMVVQRLADLNAAVTRARTDRIAKEALYKRVSELLGTANLLDAVPAIAANGFIQQLKTHLNEIERQLTEASATYGDRHPEIIRLTTARDEAARHLEAEIATVAESLRNEFLAAEAGEQSLVAALEAQKRESRDLDRKAVEYAALVREAESNRALYQNLLEQAKNVGLAPDLQRSNLRILDDAPVPRTPLGPSGRTGLVLAALASAVFAAGLGFLIEFLDPRLRTVDEVAEQLRLPMLGYLEKIRSNSHLRSSMLISAATPARFKEEVGRIRAAVEIEIGPRVGVLLTTSTGAKEGKTVVATNLALAFASAGRRVLLIDADLRRSQIHTAFDVPLAPGLSDWLQAPDGVALDEVVRPGPLPTLWLLTAGGTTSNAGDLMGGQAFAKLIRAARSAYDCVVIDSPPLMAVSDGQILAGLADHVVFVASADQTRLHAARLAIGQIRRTRANLVGVVFNRVTMSRWGAFYSAHYGSYYNSYYGVSPRPGPTA